MANPQGDKFVRWSREYQIALMKVSVPAHARQLLDFIILKTWGYHKTWDHISTVQFIKATNLSRRQVERARAILKQMNMISTDKSDGTYITKYSIQKDYEQWIPYKVPSDSAVPTDYAVVPTKTSKSTDKSGSKVPSDLTHLIIQKKERETKERDFEFSAPKSQNQNTTDWTVPMTQQNPQDPHYNAADPDNLKREVLDLRATGFRNDQIKELFLRRGIPIKAIETALHIDSINHAQEA